MFNLIGNGGPVIWLLAACGLFAALVFFERLFNLHRAQIAADDFLKGVYNILNRDNTVEAATICEEAPGPVARLALAAVLHHDDTLENIGRAIEEAGLEEIPRMERGLGWLATLARITPLIGLLGTVLGMMEMLLAANRNAPLVQSANLTGGSGLRWRPRPSVWSLPSWPTPATTCWFPAWNPSCWIWSAPLRRC